MSRKQFTIKKRLSETRTYRNFALGLFSFLVAFLIASTFAPVENSDASTVHITNNTSDYFIDITSADLLDLSVTASPSGQLAYAADSINVTTNSTNGYKLYVSTSGNDNNIYQNGSASTASSGYFYPTTGTISSPTALTQNTWGFALNKSQTTSISSTFANTAEYVNETGAPTTSSTWAAVPTFANSDQAKISELTGASNTPNGTDLDIYYGINASTTLPSGDYSTTITYTAISEGVNKFPTMQDFTAEQCYNMATDTSINLSDARDDKYYRVTKMKDGHCWMTDNLALDGTDASGNVRVLTPSDSNVTTNRPLAANITDGTTSEYDVVQIYSGVANDVTSSCDLTTNPYCVVNTTTKYGNLYNWNAATAGVGKQATTGTVTESICPKGWRLPDISGDFSYANLLGSYGLATTQGNDATHQETVKSMQKSPINIALSGGYISKVTQQGGGYMLYWSRTTYPNNDRASAMALSTANGTVWPKEGSEPKARGYAVRCIFAGQSDEIMQNFTAAQCSALAESTTTADNRKTMIDSRDGKFYKISKLADGNCWMVSNLALDGMDGLGTVRTLTPSDSNVTTNRTLATNIVNGTRSVSDVVQIYSEAANNITATCGTYTACVVSDVKYGNLYNWNAATAGVGLASTSTSISESVCAKNWRLPDHSGTKSLNELLTAYNLPLDNGSDETHRLAAISFQKAPLWFSLAGGYYDRYYNRYNASYGTRTVYESATSETYNIFFGSANSSTGANNSGFFNAATHGTKAYGYALRCVFGS